MLRALVAALVLANLLFFGWARGWFAPGWPAPRHAEREPERLAAQVRPDVLSVVPPKAASAAVAAARAAAVMCLEAGPFSTTGAAADADIAAAEAALAPAALADGAWARETVAPPSTWLVFAGRFADAPARRAKQEELKKLGLAYEALTAPEALAPGLVISRHGNREEADTALAGLADKPVKGLRVVELPGTPQQLWLRVPKADADTAERLKALPPDALAGGFKACSPRP
jgi:hypothetical protein